MYENTHALVHEMARRKAFCANACAIKSTGHCSECEGSVSSLERYIDELEQTRNKMVALALLKTAKVQHGLGVYDFVPGYC